MNEKKKSVMVAMSGGVDSTVAALLLLEQGYDVVGVTYRLWMPEDEEDLPPSACCSIDNVRDAKMVCTSLGIPHYVFNYKDLFREKVVEPFVEEYSRGRTPNPCVNCNKYIKFDAFLKKAKGMGFDYVATGHYARIEYDENRGHFRFRKGSSEKKDQSYFLYNLTREELASVLMPIGGMEKTEVREIALKNNFVAGNKPDSQDICFIPGGNYKAFLEKYKGCTNTNGDFIDTDGNVLGEHSGILNYTVGQRKGLGIAFGKPMFVKAINSDDNTVMLAENYELYTNTLYVTNLNWIDINELTAPLDAAAKVRSTALPAPCRIYPHTNGCKVAFNSPQRAITPGQAIVFYDGEYVLGGGTID